MEPAVWTCYEKGVLSQVGIFQSRFHNQCTVVCFFTQGSLGWLFFNVTKQKLSQMNYEATCTGKKLLPVFVIFLLPQFQLNYHIGQGVYISVESFSFFCKYTLSNPFSLFSTFLSLSSKKIKEPQTWGWNPLFVLAQLQQYPLLFSFTALVSPLQPLLADVGQDSLSARAMAQSDLCVEFCSLAKPSQRGQGTQALFCQVS